MVALIEGGGGPKAMARELTHRGHPVKERTVASWREGRYFPTIDVVVLMSKITGVSMDEHSGDTATEGLGERIARLEETQARIVSWLMDRDPEFVESLMKPEPEQAQAGA